MIEKYESLKSAAQARRDSKEELNPKAGENDRLEGDPMEQIQKDVHRTDRDVKAFQEDDAPLLGRMEELLYVYAVENPAIGYCQVKKQNHCRTGPPLGTFNIPLSK